MFYNSFIENPKNVRYNGEDADESILYIFRKSFILNLPWMLSVFVLIFVPFFLVPLIPNFINTGFIFATVCFWYLVLFGYSLERTLNWFFNVYIITNKKIIDVDFEGMLYKKISEASLKSVEDVTSTVKGLLGVIFNIGDVFIQTAAEKTEFEFTSVSDPSKVRDIVSDLVGTVRKK